MEPANFRQTLNLDRISARARPYQQGDRDTPHVKENLQHSGASRILRQLQREGATPPAARSLGL